MGCLRAFAALLLAEFVVGIVLAVPVLSAYFLTGEQDAFFHFLERHPLLLVVFALGLPILFFVMLVKFYLMMKGERGVQEPWHPPTERERKEERQRRGLEYIRRMQYISQFRVNNGRYPWERPGPAS